jgi:SAM-dependent methyltransferase
MRVLVIGTASPAEFLKTGETCFDEFEAVFADQGAPLSEAKGILDVGCGCGRLARWAIARGLGDRIAGVDINGPMVRWCRNNLPGRWAHIRIGQALPFEPASFDRAYACSVVTHLREESTARWFAELAAVMAPGGLLLTTFHDQYHPTANRPAADGRPISAEVLAKGYLVDIDRMEGSNRLAAYATIERLAELAGADFDLLDYRHSGRTACGQAIAIFKRR